MTASDRMTGLTLLLIAGFVFTYYTLWVLVVPFLPANHYMQSLFLDRAWSIRLPVMLLVTAITGVGAFMGSVAMKAAAKKKAKAS